MLVLRHPSPPLFPYTTLFRSRGAPRAGGVQGRDPGVTAPPADRRAVDAVFFDLFGTLLSLRALDDASEALAPGRRSEEHTSELQSQSNLVCRLLREKQNKEGN